VPPNRLAALALASAPTPGPAASLAGVGAPQRIPVTVGMQAVLDALVETGDLPSPPPPPARFVTTAYLDRYGHSPAARLALGRRALPPRSVAVAVGPPLRWHPVCFCVGSSMDGR
jgi:hypothetical protein